MRSHILLISLLFFNVHLIGQMKSTDPIVDFDSYTGYFNFAHPAQMELNFNGEDCIGSYTLLSSQSTFQLKGYLKDGKWLMEELDDNGNTSAFLIAETDGKEVWGQWKNIKKEVFIPFRFSKAAISNKKAWVKKLSGSLFNQNVEIFVQKYLNDELSGYLLLGKEKKALRFEGLCLQGNEEHLILYTTDPNNPYFTSIEIEARNENTHDVKLLDTKGARKFTTFKKSNAYAFGVNHFADYYNLYDISFPKLNHKTFDLWLAEKIDAWTKKNQKHGKIQAVLNNGNHESQRFSNQMLGWVDLSFFSNNLISGAVIMQEVESNIYKKESFLFDLKSKKLLEADQVFSDYNQIKRLIEHKGKPKLLSNSEVAESKALSNWIQSQPFEFFTFTNDQFTFSTIFHPIYGTQEITFSLEELKKYIKKSIYNRLNR